MSASAIRAASGETDPTAADFYRALDDEKAKAQREAAARLAAFEAEHGKLPRIRRGRR